MSKKSFILKNLKKLGVSKCAEVLGVARNTVYRIAKDLNVKHDKQSLSEIRSKAAIKLNEPKTQKDFESFQKIDSPQKAYLLGYFWADGHLGKNEIGMGIVKEDMDEVRDSFLETANWSIKTIKKRTKTTKEIQKIYLCNKRLCELFDNMGYKNKSQISADPVLNIIPKNLHPYWFRGYFDGDGCVCSLKNGLAPKMFITSTIKQNWSFMKELSNELKINFKIRKCKNRNYTYKKVKKVGKSSIFEISNRFDLFVFFGYIYGEHLQRFGLKRKYNKFINIFLRPMKRKLKKNKFLEGKEFKYWS